MTHGEFQQRYEEEGEKERARFDARPVADLLADIRARRFSAQYQIWYSLCARATFAEAGPVLLEILESDTDYLHRYHCAAALISIAKLDPQIYQPDKLSVGTPQAIREKIAELRRLLNAPPGPRETVPISTPPAVPAAPAAPPPLPAPARSPIITAFAWIVMILSALMLPISVISAAMLLVKSYGTNTATPLGILTVVFGPVTMLAAGFGLWRRWKWAWFLTVAILALSIVVNLHSIATVDRTPRQFISPSGVPTTIVTEGASPLWSVVAIAASVIAFLSTRYVRAEFFLKSCVPNRDFPVR